MARVSRKFDSEKRAEDFYEGLKRNCPKTNPSIRKKEVWYDNEHFSMNGMWIYGFDGYKI